MNKILKNKVRQSNVLVESTYSQEFTALELKIFEVGLFNFNIDDLELFKKKNDKVCLFSRGYLSNLLNIDPSLISQEAHRISSSLITKYIEIKNILDDGTIEFKQIGIATFCEYANGQFSIHWNYRLIPFLLEIKSNFTEFDLHYLLVLNSAYAMKLYKLLYQYKNIKVRKFSVAELKQQFGIIDKYEKYGAFKKFIIDSSIKQINDKTDLNVDYSEIKVGRKVESIEFRFSLNKKQLQSLDINQIKPLEISDTVISIDNLNKTDASIVVNYAIVDKLLESKVDEVTFKTKTMLNELLTSKGNSFVECSINYALRNAKTNFEKYLLDTISNNWANLEIKKLESKRITKEIENKNRKTKIEEKNKQMELDNTNKSEIEHLFIKLTEDEQLRYSELATSILAKHANRLTHCDVETLTYSVFAVSNGRYYNKMVEVYISKMLNKSLNINDCLM